MSIKKNAQRLERRLKRNRNRIKSTKVFRPRLSVFRSNTHIYAQIICDQTGTTLASARSTTDKKMTKTEQASLVGKKIGDLAKKAGIDKVVFDRGICKYHGRLKALADAARDKLNF